MEDKLEDLDCKGETCSAEESYERDLLPKKKAGAKQRKKTRQEGDLQVSEDRKDGV